MARRQPQPRDPELEVVESRALTVNIPTEILNRARTRANLEGTSMSALVTSALAEYADGLAAVLSRLGLNKPPK